MPLCTIGHRFAELGQLEQLFVVDWREALLHHHDWDAHAWPYVVFAGDEPAPAKRIASIAGRPNLEPNQLALCWLIFLDFDKSNDHAGILELFFNRIPESHYLRRFSAIYPTRSGMRWVYALESPITADEYGAVVRGIAFDLAALTTLQVDVSTDQWSRCMRLPSVTRHDEKADGPTWAESYWFETLHQDEVVRMSELRPRHDRLPWDTRGRPMATLAGEELPDVDHRLPPGRLSAYKKAMRVSRFREYIFVGDDGDRAVIQPGRRDQMLMALSGDTVSRCFLGVPEASAEEVFHLLVPIALGFEHDGGEPWPTKLWRMVRHSWNGEVKKQEDRVQRDAVDRTARETVQLEMAKHLPAEVLPNDPVARDAMLQRYYCLQTKKGVHVVTPTGEYTHTPLLTHQLPAYFGESLSHLSPDAFCTESGSPMHGMEILNRHSVVIDDVVYEAGERVGARLTIEGGRKILKVVPFALRSDLVERAAFDPEIDAWIGSFRDAANLRRWLPAALAVHLGPVASCYLHGPRSAGKSMLALGLADCFFGQPVPASQAFAEFNGALIQNPVIMIDEGLPDRRGGMSTADLFRSLVTGSAVSTMAKYQDAAVSRIPYRLIFAANSFDMVQTLIGKRSLGSQDRDAFTERILVVECGDGPSEYLRKNGSMSFTKDSPKGSWIGGECRLARHLIHLYLQQFKTGSGKEWKRDGRMLVEGKIHPGFTLAFDLSGSGRTVVDDLVRSLASITSKKQTASPALFLAMEVDSQGRVWLKKRPFVKQMVGIGSAARDEQAYSLALDRFLTGLTRTSPVDMSTQYEIDIAKVAYCGDSEGLSIASLMHYQVAQATSRSVV